MVVVIIVIIGHDDQRSRSVGFFEGATSNPTSVRGA